MRQRYLAGLFTAVGLLFVVAIWFDLSPLLRGPDEWRWSLRQAQVPDWQIVIPLAALAIYVLLCVKWLTLFTAKEPAKRSTQWAERGFLMFLTLAAPLIQIALAAAVWRSPLFEFFSATVSPSVTGFHSVAVTTPNLTEQLAHYAAFMPTLPIHPQTHPPGLVLLQWLSWRWFVGAPIVSDAIAMPLRTLQCHNVALMTLDNPQIASATLGMLIPVLGGFTVWPLFAFGKRVIGLRGAALAAAVFPILPMFALWPSQWDQVFPLFLLGSLYFLHRGLEECSTWRIFSAGVILSCATFLNVGNAVMAVIASLYGLSWWITRRPIRQLLGRPAAQWGRQIIALGAGGLSIWLTYALIYQVRADELIAVGMRLASEATRCPMCPSTARSYNVWVVWNVVDFAIFLGVPVALLFAARLPMLLKRAGHRRPTSWAPLALAVLVTFALLDLSGIVRGEVSRLWAYFGPVMVLLACVRDDEASPLSPRRSMVFLGLIALQLLAMNTRWQPYPSFLDEPPIRSATFSAPSPQVSVEVSFGRQIELVGYDRQDTAQAVNLKLYWQALTQPPHAYTIFVHVLDSVGQLIAQRDNMPVNDQLPTSCWSPREFVTDPYSIDLPPNVSGPLSIEIGLYRLDTGERLLRDDGQGSSFNLRP
jgi:hypothetical protein